MIKKYTPIQREKVLAVQWVGDNVEDLIQMKDLHFYMRKNTPIVVEEVGDVECQIGDYIVRFPTESHCIVARQDFFESLYEEVKE